MAAQGEVSSSSNGIDFLWDARNDAAMLRSRYGILRFQLVGATLVSMIFVHNTWHSIRVVARFPDKLAPWCCLFMSLLGLVMFCFIAVPFVGLDGPACRATCWSLAMGVVLSAISANVVLFERAYIACRRPRWLLVAGLLLALVPGLAYMAVVCSAARATYDEEYGCYLDYPAYLPYARAFADIPQNITFGAVFCMVIYRNYRRHREQLWKELARDGIVTMLAVAVSNVTCFIIAEINFLGGYSNLVYITDWVIASTLLTESVYRMHITARTNTCAKTEQKHSAATDMPRGAASTTCYRAFATTGMTTFHALK